MSSSTGPSAASAQFVSPEFEAPNALLIGRSGDASPVAVYLRKIGYECCFAFPATEVYRLLDTRNFALILGPIRLNGESMYPLIDRLDGSRASLFYSLEVEDSCLWMPALQRGVNCFGTPALRPSEFVRVLDKTIAQIRSATRMTAESRSANPPHRSAAIITLPPPRRVSVPSIATMVEDESLEFHKTLG